MMSVFWSPERRDQKSLSRERSRNLVRRVGARLIQRSASLRWSRRGRGRSVQLCGVRRSVDGCHIRTIVISRVRL